MKILLVLWGETFRSGPQLSRIRGIHNYKERQFLASKSHVELINQIYKKYSIDMLDTGD